jgi:hypothetical protein
MADMTDHGRSQTGGVKTPGAGGAYVRVLVVWVLVLAALYLFQESFR